MSSIARYYDESKNENGGALPGVPLADITEEQFNALPPWLQASVDASPMYRKSKPHTERAAAKEDIAKSPAASAQTEKAMKGDSP